MSGTAQGWRSAGVAAVAVASLVGGTAWALGDAGDDALTRPTPTSAAPGTDPEGPEADDWPGHLPARYVDGEVEVAPGVVVHRHLPDPLHLPHQQVSDALDVTVDGRRTWVILEGNPENWSTLTAGPGGTWATFRDWVESTDSHGGIPLPTLVEQDDDGKVVAASGAVIVERTDRPRLGDTFAPPDAPQGAAIVAAEDEYTYLVVWREPSPGELDVAAVVAGTGAELEPTLAWARQGYAAGEILRLE